MKRILFSLGSLALAPVPLAAQEISGSLPLTTAERTGFTRTSSHAEVVEFLETLATAHPDLRLETLGHTAEGREILLARAGLAARLGPAGAARAGVPVVYVQGNIHGGEVCGKDAMLALLRDLLGQEGGELLEKLVLLVVPNYNPDGNDRFAAAERNRPGQVGPEEVGTRENASGLDLNRDYMKAASEELRAVLGGVVRVWDPDVLIDLHTTNGSLHGFQLTYAPPLQPSPGSGYLAPEGFVRERLLRPVRRSLADQGFACFDYGNFGRGEAATRWSTYDHRPRFGTNYMALRGRMAVLSEAYSYADFRTRVEVTRRFVHALLERIATEGATIRALHAEHERRIVGWGRDPSRAPELGIDFELARRDQDELVLAGTLRRDAAGRPRPGGELEARTVEVFDRFAATRGVPYPAGFFLPASEERLLGALERHGVRIERLREGWSGDLERFHPTEVRIAARPFQERHMVRARGERRTERVELAAGSCWVSTAQPLGLLASYLLDPEYDDGLIAWRETNFEPVAGEPFPVLRALAVPMGLLTR